MSKKCCNKEENERLHKKSDNKEPSKKICFDNRHLKNYFCEEDYSESPRFEEDYSESPSFEEDYSEPPCFEEDICKKEHHKEKKNKEHKDCKVKEKLMKCKVVITRKHVQKIGTLVIPAPIGVGIDITTGKLTVPVELEPCGEPVFTPKIINDTLINEGYAPVKLIIKDRCMASCAMMQKGFSEKFFIPFQSETKIKGIKSDDEVDEKIKIESLAVFGFPEVMQQKCGGVITKLILKVILDVKITVSRERVLPVVIKACKHDC